MDTFLSVLILTGNNMQDQNKNHCLLTNYTAIHVNILNKSILFFLNIYKGKYMYISIIVLLSI